MPQLYAVGSLCVAGTHHSLNIHSSLRLNLLTTTKTKYCGWNKKASSPSDDLLLKDFYLLAFKLIHILGVANSLHPGLLGFLWLLLNFFFFLTEIRCEAMYVKVKYPCLLFRIEAQFPSFQKHEAVRGWVSVGDADQTLLVREV